MDWLNTLSKLAPTVASAFLGPMGGAAVSAIGGLLGMTDATQKDIAEAFTNGKLSADQISAIKQLELKYQNDEKERGFKYAELAYQDRDSARKANVAGGVQKPLFFMSLLLLATGLGTEGFVLFHGVPPNVDDLITGRVLGLMDAVIMLVLSYWYGTTNGSQSKDSLLANSTPAK